MTCLILECQQIRNRIARRRMGKKRMMNLLIFKTLPKVRMTCKYKMKRDKEMMMMMKDLKIFKMHPIARFNKQMMRLRHQKIIT